jgi:hypothetical protein
MGEENSGQTLLDRADSRETMSSAALQGSASSAGSAGAGLAGLAGLAGTHTRQDTDHAVYIPRPYDDPGDLDPFEIERVLLQAQAEQLTQRSLVLNGVPWAQGRGKRGFEGGFVEGLRDVNLSGAEKMLIVDRFVGLTRVYRSSRSKWKWLSHSARVVVTVGSIIVPAMITLDDDIRERSTASQILAYTVFGVSLTVSIVNGLQEYFSAGNRYVTAQTTAESLESEGWSFLALSGRYARFATHAECTAGFLARTELIHAAAVNVNASLVRRPSDDERAGTAARINRGYFAATRLGDEIEQALEGPVVYTDH